jgi:RimJ/RimL family protein N-acetyltransferase
MKLEGGKIYLKPSSVKYAEVYTKWINDPDVIRHTTIVPVTLEEEMKWLKKRETDKTEEVFSIFTKEDDTIIGNVGCHELDNPDRNFVLGIIIGEKEYWGKGYGTDAFKTIIKYMFDERNANKLSLDVFAGNKAAKHVYEKCGFKEVGKIKKMNPRTESEVECYKMELTRANFF